MKLSRLPYLLVLPLLVAGCTTWKFPGKSAPPSPEASPVGQEPTTKPDFTSPTRTGVPTPTPTPETKPASRTFVPEIDFSTPYGSVRRHGRLIAVGNRIVGEHGMPVSLAGNSFFWSQWQGSFFNADVVKWLKLDWKTAIIRIPLGVEHNGYLTNPDEEYARLCTLVDAAIAADLYVVIDWHDHNAHRHTEQAIFFFQKIARKYGDKPHVAYEIYNEPTGNTSWTGDIKPYAEKVIAAIRTIDPDNLIIVGTPTWSQDVDVAADNPIAAKNIAYALHFYAGTHKQWLRDKALKALQKGLPLFVTEWGSCNADGKGEVDEVSVREWMDFMQEWGLSHCNWAVSEKLETASIVVPGSSPTGRWLDSELTPSGRLAREWIRSWAAATP